LKNCLLVAIAILSLAAAVNAQSIQERIASAEIRDLAIKKEAQRQFGDDAVLFVSGNEISIGSTGHFNHRLQHYVENFALQVLWNANYTTTYGGTNWNFEYVHVSASAYNSFLDSHDQGEAIVRLSDYSSKEALSAACDHAGLKDSHPTKSQKAVSPAGLLANAEKDLQAAWNNLMPAQRANLKNDELAWIKTKDACKNESEKLKMVTDRIEFLNEFRNRSTPPSQTQSVKER
jgi:hypothetical protein